MKKLPAAVGLSLLLTACVGTQFYWSEVRQLQPGMTTTEVTNRIGRPYMVITDESGDLVYIWSHANALGGAKSLRLNFKEGKLVSVPHVPDNF